MSNKRYPEEFKIEAVKQITESKYPISEVSSRLGVSQHSLYQWVKLYGLSALHHTRHRPHRLSQHAKTGALRPLLGYGG